MDINELDDFLCAVIEFILVTIILYLFNIIPIELDILWVLSCLSETVDANLQGEGISRGFYFLYSRFKELKHLPMR